MVPELQTAVKAGGQGCLQEGPAGSTCRRPLRHFRCAQLGRLKARQVGLGDLGRPPRGETCRQEGTTTHRSAKPDATTGQKEHRTIQCANIHKGDPKD